MALVLLGCTSKPKIYSEESAAIDFEHQLNTVKVNLPTGQAQDIYGLVGNQDISLWLNRYFNGSSIDSSSFDNPPQLVRMLNNLEVSRLSTEVTKSRSLPEVSLSTSGTRAKQDGAVRSTSNNFNLQLSTQWEVDIWGKLEADNIAAQSEFKSLELDTEYFKRTLLANIIKNWLSWTNAKKQLLVAQEQYRTSAKNESIILGRYKSGLGGLADLDSARVKTHEAKATIEANQQLVSEHYSNLKTLLGSVDAIADIPEQWPEVNFPAATISGATLSLRPDLQSAYYKIIAADNKSKVAYSELLPSFKLTLNSSLTSSKASELFDVDPVWSLIGQFTQPIFNSGRLKNNVKISEYQAENAYLTYKEKLISAVNELEIYVLKEQRLAAQQQALRKALTQAEINKHNYEVRYTNGVVDILDLLNTQQTAFTLQSQLLTIELNRAANRIDLGLSLGLPLKQGT